MMDRLVVGHTLRNWVFAATTVHMNPIYDITFLALYPSLCTLSGQVGEAVRYRELAVLPAAHPEKEAHDIRLLLPP